jgi:hypothetical protein
MCALFDACRVVSLSLELVTVIPLSCPSSFHINARTFAAVRQMKQSEEGTMSRVPTPGPRDQRPELSAFVDLLPFLEGVAEGPPGLF